MDCCRDSIRRAGGGVKKYILDSEGVPQEETDLFAWANWFEEADRHVADTMVEKYRVSTIFLGLDHSFFETSLPVLWETMVFPDCEKMRRYTSKAEAEAGHWEMVEWVIDNLLEDDDGQEADTETEAGEQQET